MPATKTTATREGTLKPSFFTSVSSQLSKRLLEIPILKALLFLPPPGFNDPAATQIKPLAPFSAGH